MEYNPGNDFCSFLKINPGIQIFEESFQGFAEYEKSTNKTKASE